MTLNGVMTVLVSFHRKRFVNSTSAISAVAELLVVTYTTGVITTIVCSDNAVKRHVNCSLYEVTCHGYGSVSVLSHRNYGHKPTTLAYVTGHIQNPTVRRICWLLIITIPRRMDKKYCDKMLYTYIRNYTAQVTQPVITDL